MVVASCAAGRSAARLRQAGPRILPAAV